jgi:hypothetical protein
MGNTGNQSIKPFIKRFIMKLKRYLNLFFLLYNIFLVSIWRKSAFEQATLFRGRK